MEKMEMKTKKTRKVYAMDGIKRCRKAIEEHRKTIEEFEDEIITLENEEQTRRTEWKRRVEEFGPNIYSAVHVRSDEEHFVVGHFDCAENVYEVLHKRSPGGTIRGTFTRCRTHFNKSKARQTAIERYGYAKLAPATISLGDQYRIVSDRSSQDLDPFSEFIVNRNKFRIDRYRELIVSYQEMIESNQKRIESWAKELQS